VVVVRRGSDGAGNPTKLGSSTAAYDEASQLEHVGTTSYSFDEEGDRTEATPSSGPATSYGYDQAGNLTSVDRAGEGESTAIEDSYSYDGGGLRSSEASGETTKHLTWDSSEELPLILSDQGDSFLYGPADTPIEQIDSEGHVSYLHHDQAGSTRLLTDETGEGTGKCSYSAYGTPTCEGATTTSLGFDGQYTDPDTGLVYLRARVYDPASAQFMSVDPWEQLTREPYTFVGDDPLNHGDPFGLFPWGDILEGIGVGASCLLGPEVCVPAGLAVVDAHVVKADINSAITGCSPWPEIIHAGVSGVVSSLPFAGGLAAKEVWEASHTAFRIGATGGVATGSLAGATAASNDNTSCGC
jgi:RHS repeat-associated protein